ncbi:MAG: glycoside hydrolase family 3 N-terminal domain-containing protein [Bacteroidota bacterium]
MKRIALILFLLPLFLVSQPTLQQKVAQMVMVSFTGTTIPDSIKMDIQKRGLGGIILYAGNITSASQVALLTSQLSALSSSQLLIAVDQEGGKVARLSAANGFANTPTAYHLGTGVNREDSTRANSALMAGWVRQSGFNIDFAPVADVNVNPLSPAIGKSERSYSANPDTVARHTAWFVDEFRKKGVITTMKHFPGHGSAATDSHLGFTDVTTTWSSKELIPYQTAIKNGMVDMVMIGHLFNSKIDSVYPASLSAKTIGGLLRDSLGFNGVVISDALTMGAISLNYAMDDVIERSVNSGTDILLWNGNSYNNRSLLGYIIDVVTKKVADGKIAASRIDTAYNRIQRLKQRILTNISRSYAVDIPTEMHLEQNYPNPFNPSTTIGFTIPAPGVTSLKVYDAIGREIAVLADGYLESGIYYSRNFDASKYSSGIFFAQLRSGSAMQMKKMIYLK